jgi:hypothetical protein
MAGIFLNVKTKTAPALSRRHSFSSSLRVGSSDESHEQRRGARGPREELGVVLCAHEERVRAHAQLADLHALAALVATDKLHRRALLDLGHQVRIDLVAMSMSLEHFAFTVQLGRNAVVRAFVK